MVKFTI